MKLSCLPLLPVLVFEPLVFELLLVSEPAHVWLLPLLALLLGPVLGANLLTPKSALVCIAPLLVLFLHLPCFC